MNNTSGAPDMGQIDQAQFMEFMKFQEMMKNQAVAGQVKTSMMTAQMNNLNVLPPQQFGGPGPIGNGTAESEKQPQTLEMRSGFQNDGYLPNNAASFGEGTQSDDENNDDPLPEEKPTRQSKRANKQISGQTIYDMAQEGPKKKQVGRKVPENIEMESDDEQASLKQKLAGINEQKVPCPLDQERMIYASVWMSENDVNEEAKCDICLGDDDNEGDEMVFCDGCNVVAHQTCYGRDVAQDLPSEDELWFCQRCRFIEQNDQTPFTVKCIFCTDRQGLITKNNFGWAHITCVNWMPEIWYHDGDNREVRGEINNDRKGLFCYICKNKKREGHLLQCDFRDCRLNFHVRCAIKDKMIQDWESMNDQREKEDSYDCFIFCNQHKTIGVNVLQTHGAQGLNPSLACTEVKSNRRSKQSSLLQDNHSDEEFKVDIQNEDGDQSDDDNTNYQESNSRSNFRQKQRTPKPRPKSKFQQQPQKNNRGVNQNRLTTLQNEDEEMMVDNNPMADNNQMMNMNAPVLPGSLNTLNQQQIPQQQMQQMFLNFMQNFNNQNQVFGQTVQPGQMGQQIPQYNPQQMQQMFQGNQQKQGNKNQRTGQGQKPPRQRYQQQENTNNRRQKKQKQQNPTNNLDDNDFQIIDAPPSKNPASRTFQPQPPKPQSKSGKIQVDPIFAQLINIPLQANSQNYITDRVKLQQCFINFAIQNNLVSETDHNYRVGMIPYLKEKIGKESFDPKYLFQNLQPFLRYM